MKKYIATILLFCSVSVGQSLNIDECVRIALENKPSLKRAEQDVTIARLNRASTGALMLPSVNANNSFSETTYGNSSSESTERYSGGLSLSQSLFNFGSKINALKHKVNFVFDGIWSVSCSLFFLCLLVCLLLRCLRCLSVLLPIAIGYYSFVLLWRAVIGMFSPVKRNYNIQWQWVKGHSNNEGNEEADTLANKGRTDCTTHSRYHQTQS
jgi:hypothetical protein